MERKQIVLREDKERKVPLEPLRHIGSFFPQHYYKSKRDAVKFSSFFLPVPLVT